MSNQYSPPWLTGAGRTSRAGAAGAALRLSDADRTEITDQLSRHFSEGRLDQAEFDERLHQAMSAKTRQDLNGLLDDLPALHDGAAAPVPARRPARAVRPGQHRLLVAVLVIVAAIAVGQVLSHLFFFPWLWVALAIFLWLRYGRRGYRHRRSDDWTRPRRP